MEQIADVSTFMCLKNRSVLNNYIDELLFCFKSIKF